MAGDWKSPTTSNWYSWTMDCSIGWSHFEGLTNTDWPLVVRSPVLRSSDGCARNQVTGIWFTNFISAYRHLVLRFWNQVFTCESVMSRSFARSHRSEDARYFCRWKRLSSSMICVYGNGFKLKFLEIFITCCRLKDVRGFFRFGGVLFWYGWPTRRGSTIMGDCEIISWLIRMISYIDPVAICRSSVWEESVGIWSTGDVSVNSLDSSRNRRTWMWSRILRVLFSKKVCHQWKKMLTYW